MDAQRTSSFNYETLGTSALAPQSVQPRLTLLRGGRDPQAYQPHLEQTDTTATFDRSTVKRYKHGFIVAVIIVGFMFAAGLIASDQLAAQRIAQAQAHLHYTSSVVMPGDTLWAIAEAHRIKGMSTRETLRLIEERNHVSSQTLSVGMSLSVPQ